MNSVFNKIVTGSAVVALSFALFSTTSLAAETSTAINGGTVGISGVTATTFTSVTLDGKTQTTTANLSTFDATDARGTGEGWKVDVKASQFKDATDATKVKTLPAGSLAIAAPAVSLKDPGSSLLDTITTAGGIIDNTTGVKLVSAALNGGMGSYTVAPSAMTLTLKPGTVYAGNYASTVTVSLTTGP